MPLYALAEVALAISSVSFNDYASISGVYYDTFLSTRKNKNTIQNRGYSDAVLEQMRAAEIKSFSSIEIVGIRFTKPFEAKYELFTYVWLLYQKFKLGSMPFPGSVSEQPNQIIEIFSLLDALELEKDKQQQKGIKPQKWQTRR